MLRVGGANIALSIPNWFFDHMGAVVASDCRHRKEEIIMKNFSTVCVFIALLASATSAHAYFVRPFYSQSGTLTDGLIENGATSGQQNFGNSLQTDVNLDDGTVKALLDISGTNMSVQAGGSFGDTIVFNNATGTTVDFDFAFDGTIDVTGVVNLGSSLQYGVFANLFVFEAGSGATATNFSSIGGELIGESTFLSFTDPAADVINQLIDDALSGSVAIGAVQSFDVFSSLSVFTSTNDNPVSVTMDFQNTGTFGIDAAPGVTYSSASGVFLDSVTASSVPAPPTLILLACGGLLGIVTRRRQITPLV